VGCRPGGSPVEDISSLGESNLASWSGVRSAIVKGLTRESKGGWSLNKGGEGAATSSLSFLGIRGRRVVWVNLSFRAKSVRKKKTQGSEI